MLDRQDILPTEDVAFLQAYEWMYNTKDRSRVSVEKKCKKWKPYSSIAARYLYRALDMGLTKNEFHLYKQKVGGIMHFPNEIMIYEILICSMPEEEFKRRWEKWKNKWYEYSEQMGRSAEETEEVVNNIMATEYPRNVWKYNQIVGFVEIAIGPRDIAFNVQKTLDKRIQAVGKTKHYIQDMMTNGMHFSFNSMTNAEIVAKVDIYLDSIEKEITKPFCLYRDTYNNTKNHIDFKGVV